MTLSYEAVQLEYEATLNYTNRLMRTTFFLLFILLATQCTPLNETMDIGPKRYLVTNHETVPIQRLPLEATKARDDATLHKPNHPVRLLQDPPHTRDRMCTVRRKHRTRTREDPKLQSFFYQLFSSRNQKRPKTISLYIGSLQRL